MYLGYYSLSSRQEEERMLPWQWDSKPHSATWKANGLRMQSWVTDTARTSAKMTLLFDKDLWLDQKYRMFVSLICTWAAWNKVNAKPFLTKQSQPRVWTCCSPTCLATRTGHSYGIARGAEGCEAGATVTWIGAERTLGAWMLGGVQGRKQCYVCIPLWNKGPKVGKKSPCSPQSLPCLP